MADIDMGPQGRPYYAQSGQRSAGARHGPHWTICILLVIMNKSWNAYGRRHPRPGILGPKAPATLTQEHGTYVTKRAYNHMRNTHIDSNTIRNQPAAARAAHGLSLITMNITSWNSKIYRYVASLTHDVIFIQEHRKTMPSQIKVPEGYKIIFAPAQITGSKHGGTLNNSGGVAILIKE